MLVSFVHLMCLLSRGFDPSRFILVGNRHQGTASCLANPWWSWKSSLSIKVWICKDIISQVIFGSGYLGFMYDIRLTFVIKSTLMRDIWSFPRLSCFFLWLLYLWLLSSIKLLVWKRCCLVRPVGWEWSLFGIICTCKELHLWYSLYN